MASARQPAPRGSTALGAPAWLCRSAHVNPSTPECTATWSPRADAHASRSAHPRATHAGHVLSFPDQGRTFEVSHEPATHPSVGGHGLWHRVPLVTQKGHVRPHGAASVFGVRRAADRRHVPRPPRKQRCHRQHLGTRSGEGRPPLLHAPSERRVHGAAPRKPLGAVRPAPSDTEDKRVENRPTIISRFLNPPVTRKKSSRGRPRLARF